MNPFEISETCSKKISLRFFGKKFLSLPYIKRNYIKKTDNELKFGVAYSVFDGEELLEKSIISIRSEVDYIIVVYQTISWFGAPCDKNLLKTLQELKDKNLIDELVEFCPDLKVKSQLNETKKRSTGLSLAIKAGCNYFMSMDVDEFYFAEELKNAKKIIAQGEYTNFYCPQYCYGDRPTKRSTNIAHFCVPFFSKIDELSKIGDNQYSPCLTDPTRKILERKGSKHYVLHNIAMHHMAFLRKNLKLKIQNSSDQYSSYDQKLRGCNDFLKMGSFIEVEDYFSLKEVFE